MTELLAGLKVLDLSLWQPGHTATQLLADLGADVLKVEPPGGDPERIMPDRVASYYTHKRSLVLDLKSDAGKARLLELAAQADVLVEGYRPGVADRLGAGYATLSQANPALVYCSITGFGQTGPLAKAPGHEHNYQAWAGAYVQPAEGKPVAAKPLVGDQGSGTAAAFAILAAVLCAQRTGVGEHIDVSMADLIASWVAPAGPIGEDGKQGESVRQPAMGEFRTADGKWLVLGIFSENHLWAELCRQLGLPELADHDMAQRSAQCDVLKAQITERIAAQPRDALMAKLGAAGVPLAPVLTREEAMSLPHFWERGVFTRSPEGARLVAHPIRYTNHPARMPGRAPAVGEGGDRGFD